MSGGQGSPRKKGQKTMKKITAIIMVSILIIMTSATALAKTVYDPEKLHFLIVAKDEKTRDTYVTTVSYKTAVKRIVANLVYEIYMLESDSIVPVDYVVDETLNAVAFTNRLTGELIEQ
jgi:hypothetical protein